MGNKLVVEWTLEEIATLAHEWTGKILTPAQAEKVLNYLKKHAIEDIRSAGTSVIFDYLEDTVK